jgi:hypothetical protein
MLSAKANSLISNPLSSPRYPKFYGLVCGLVSVLTPVKRPETEKKNSKYRGSVLTTLLDLNPIRTLGCCMHSPASRIRDKSMCIHATLTKTIFQLHRVDLQSYHREHCRFHPFIISKCMRHLPEKSINDERKMPQTEPPRGSSQLEVRSAYITLTRSILVLQNVILDAATISRQGSSRVRALIRIRCGAILYCVLCIMGRISEHS